MSNWVQPSNLTPVELLLREQERFEERVSDVVDADALVRVFEPTEEQRSLVKEMATAGNVSIGRICRMIRWPDGEPITASLLMQHFERELLEGRVAADVKVAGALYKAALAGSVQAMIEWLKRGERERNPGAAPPGRPPSSGEGLEGVVLLPGPISSEEWAAIAEAEQEKLARRAASFLSGGVVDNDPPANPA